VARIGDKRVLEPVRFLERRVLLLNELEMPFEFDVLLPDKPQLCADRVAHALETLVETAEFGWTFDGGHGSVQIAGGDGFGNVDQLLERRRHGA
jgi:hypothetical protein